MFTGIIQHVGTIQAADPTAAGRRLSIDLGPLAEGLQPGQSIAVNGVCLTAGAVHPGRGEFDVVRETLDRTTLGRLGVGDAVNLEPALRADGLLDGHIVQGHIDTTARVHSIDRRDGRVEIHFSADADQIAQMVPKGSVAIDGVSLTLTEAAGDRFGVALIPTTLAETTLKDRHPGDAVNIELDVIGKYVRRYLQAMLAGSDTSAGGLTLEKLREAGFA
jgi:riboflavin synthase